MLTSNHGKQICKTQLINEDKTNQNKLNEFNRVKQNKSNSANQNKTRQDNTNKLK